MPFVSHGELRAVAGKVAKGGAMLSKSGLIYFVPVGETFKIHRDYNLRGNHRFGYNNVSAGFSVSKPLIAGSLRENVILC